MSLSKIVVVTDRDFTNNEMVAIRNIADKVTATVSIIELNNSCVLENKYDGLVDCVITIDSKKYNINQIKSWLTKYVQEFKPTVVFFCFGWLCNVLASFVAAKLRTGIIVNCIDVEWQDEELVYSRVAMNSSSIVKIQFKNTKTQIVTVRSFSFVKCISIDNYKNKKTLHSKACIELFDENDIFNKASLLSNIIPNQEQDYLENDIYIEVGYGARNMVKEIFGIADKIGAAFGATKKIIDYGFVKDKYLVGQSGRIIKSKLCIAVGVSGQLQHIVGIVQSKKIVAINNDPVAEIFNYCDFGIICKAEDIIGKIENEIYSFV